MTIMTQAEKEHLARLTPDDLFSVYSGKPGKCCCGCAGNHRYWRAHRIAAGKHRGYEVDEEDINDRQVARVLKLLQNWFALVEYGGSYFAGEIDGRLYIAYLKQ